MKRNEWVKPWNLTNLTFASLAWRINQMLVLFIDILFIPERLATASFGPRYFLHYATVQVRYRPCSIAGCRCEICFCCDLVYFCRIYSPLCTKLWEPPCFKASALEMSRGAEWKLQLEDDRWCGLKSLLAQTEETVPRWHWLVSQWAGLTLACGEKERLGQAHLNLTVSPPMCHKKVQYLVYRVYNQIHFNT